MQAWLFGLAVPAVALFMLFSLLPYDRMVGHWPWGIGKEEVMAFQHLFDRRPGQHVEGHAEVFTLTEQGPAGKVMLSAGKDKVARVLFAGRPKFEIKVPNDYSIEVDEPRYGKLVYDAKIDLLE